MKTARILLAGLMLTCLLASTSAVAGVLDPECTPEKAAKGAAAKATVGVGGRCKPGETVKDSGKRAVGADDEKKNDDDDGGVAKKAADKANDD
jgi:hypothetical protein